MNRLAASPGVACLLDTHLAHESDAAWYRAPAIPEKKLRNAIGKYACHVPPESVLALGDGTVFGSAKEGILITADTLFARTTEESFSVPMNDIVKATKLGGWPTYGVELECCDGSTHRISTSCFDKKQDSLVDFLNLFATVDTQCVAEQSPPPARSSEAAATVNVNAANPRDTSILAVNAGLRLIGVCEQEKFDDTGALFDAALQADTEWPLLKGYCQYVGFNGRQVDGIFLLTNRRLLLFSMEMGSKIVCVELTRRLLGKLPVPFIDSIVCFLMFSIPRAAYVALQGGKEKLIAQALRIKEERLLADKPPLRKVQQFSFPELAQSVAQADIGIGVWTGILERRFGVSFAPVELAKTFSVPKDLILPEYETLDPFEQLLYAIRSTLARIGMDYRLDARRQKLTIALAAAEKKAAA